MHATTSQLEAALAAARALLGARIDDMLTVEEVTALARAVAACDGRETASLLTPRDLEDVAAYKVAWTTATDGPLPEAE